MPSMGPAGSLPRRSGWERVLGSGSFRVQVSGRLEDRKAPCRRNRVRYFFFCELRAFRSEPDSGFVVEELCVLDRLRELQPNPIPGASGLTPIEPFIPVLFW